MEEKVQALLAKIESAGAAGVHGQFVAELKELAAAVREDFPKEEEKKETV